MPRLSVAPDELAPEMLEVHLDELRRIARDLSGLLVTIVGESYAFRVGLPDTSQRRDAGHIEQAGQRAALLVEQLAALIAAEPPDDRQEWDTD